MRTHYEFTESELLIIHNSLNEVLHGFPVADFDAAIGVSRHHAESLGSRLDSGGNSVVLSGADRRALGNSVGLAVKELGSEFATRVGASIGDAEKLIGELSAA